MFATATISNANDPYCQDLTLRLLESAIDTDETYRLFGYEDRIGDLTGDDNFTHLCLEGKTVTAAAQFVDCGAGPIAEKSYVVHQWGGGNLIRHKNRTIDPAKLSTFPGYDLHQGGKCGYLKRIQRFYPHDGAVQAVIEPAREIFDFIELTTWNPHAFDCFRKYGFVDTGLRTGAVSEYKIMTWAK